MTDRSWQVVRAYVFDKDDRILMVKHYEKWRRVLPWWHLEWNETLYECIEREIMEEFNLKVEVFWEVNWVEDEWVSEKPLPVGIYNISYESPRRWKITKLEYVFFVDVVSWELKVQDREIFDYKRFTVSEILSFDPSKDTYKQIQTVLEKNIDDICIEQ